MRWLQIALVFAALALGTAAQAAPPRAPDPVVVAPGEGEALDRYLSAVSAYGYSFSILAARDGRVILRKAYGPGLSTDSVFNVASVSKQFTATLILQLAAEGRLRLSDPLTRYFPDAPKRFNDVTVDHLLAHTSGIRDDYGLYQREPMLGRAAFQARIFARKLASPPGQTWDYCNDCYGLLAMIVEKVTGRPFTEEVRRRLFAPAGMSRTGFMGDHWPQAERPTPFGGSLPLQPFVTRWVGLGLGASAVVTNPSDLYRWQLAMESGRILPPAWRDKLTEPQIVVFPPVLSYARGWWVRRTKIGDQPLFNIFHSGVEDDGANAWYSRYPDRRTVLIFASAQAVDGLPLREAFFAGGGPSPLETILFGRGSEAPPMPQPLGEVSGLAGAYHFADGSWIEADVRAPFLILTPHGQAAFDRLLPAGAGEAAPKVLAAATERGEQVLAALSRSDREPFRKAVGERDDGAEVAPPQVDQYEVLGSYPVRKVSGEGTQVVTRARIRSGSAWRTWRLAWSGETLQEAWPSDQPVVPPFRAVAGGRFANWQPFIRATAEVRFDAGGLLAGGDRASRAKAPLGRARPS